MHPWALAQPAFGGIDMGLFTREKRPQGGGSGQPATMPLASGPLASGRRLRSDLSPQDCVEVLQQVFDGYRPRRHQDMPPLVPAGIRWTSVGGGPSLAVSGDDDSDDFLLFTFAGADGGTEAGIFPLGSGDERLALNVVGHWKRRDNSLASIGTWPPRTVWLTPPPIEDSLVDGTLQAAGYPLTPENRAKIAQQFTIMFLVKCQEFVSSREGARGAERFVAAHGQRRDSSSLAGLLRSPLQQLAEWEPGVLPYVQDLPLRIRSILLEGDRNVGVWSELAR
jgi:hypothetical protein